MKTAFHLGETVVHAVLHQRRIPSPTMLNVHHDEGTSVQAGLVNLKKYGGRLIELVHSGERLITFRLDGTSYSFDPNRIFSEAGIAETLRRHSRYSEAAHAEIRTFAARYLAHFALDQELVIIALHNATDGIFSVESFLPGEYLGRDAAAIHVNRNRSRFDFFFVTERGFFDELQRRDFNVVLQDNQQVTDDGSLSVYFAKKGIPYINVEAKIDHLGSQIEMLDVVRDLLNGSTRAIPA